MRPYEKMIERLTADHTHHHTVFEPFAGLGRASRLLLNLGHATHAELNDYEEWPLILHGHDAANTPASVSPRITDEFNNPDVPLRGWHRQTTISRQDWYAFTYRNNYRPGIWVFDPPYDADYKPILNTAFNLSAQSHVMVFGPQSLADKTRRFWTTHEFAGPRQNEIVMVRDKL